MPIDFPLKKGDYEVVDTTRIDYTNALGDLDASTIIDPQEYDTTQVIAKQYEDDLIEKPAAGNWFNLSETAGNTTNHKNYWSINKDVVFYLIQSEKTDGVIWTFMAAPSQVTITKNLDYTAEQNWASNERTITYGGTTMKKVSLGEILIEGLSTKVNAHKKVNQLEKLLDPVQYKKHIAPLVFELIVKPKGGLSQESRSFGNYLITNLSLTEVLRDHSGRALRVVATMELQEVPSYQINNGRDLTLPDNLVVKVDKTAKDQLTDEKKENPDGSTEEDFKEGLTSKDITYRDSNNKLVKGKEVTRTQTIDDKNYEVTWIEDTNGERVGDRRFVLVEGEPNKVNKIQPTSSGVKKPYTNNVVTAPSE